METIAVYWEETIRTYGFNLFEGQVLCEVSLPNARMAQWGRTLQNLDAGSAPFRLVWGQPEPQNRIKFYLLCDDTHWQKVRPVLEKALTLDLKGEKLEHSKADVLFFHGPHFGDRYGILDFTLKALVNGGVPLLAEVCSVASIYLVLPVGWGREAKTVLSQAFEIPMEKRDIDPSPK